MDSNSLVALSNLLKPPEDYSDSENELEAGPSPYVTPGSIGPKTTPNDDIGALEACVSSSKDIWNNEEVSSQQHYEYDDLRPEPEYEMIYKQVVTAEDIFLGMGNKNPTTASCEDMVVKIKLPDVNAKDIELNITEVFLDCRCPKWRLGLHLPHKVDSSQSKAQWIADKESLQVTLRLTREFDLLNQ